MHRLFFSIKRVHWMWQKKAAELLELRDAYITPARFNLLRTLHTYRHGIAQFKLAQLLGVAGPGVSRMLKALEEEGLVWRERYENDRRYMSVHLTAGGKVLVEETLGMRPDDKFDDILDYEASKWFASSKFVDVELDILDRFLIRARCRRLDRAIYPVPWNGGEVLPWEPGTIAMPPPMEIIVADAA